MEGGHTVPIEKIVSRYARSMSNLSTILEVADRQPIDHEDVDAGVDEEGGALLGHDAARRGGVDRLAGHPRGAEGDEGRQDRGIEPDLPREARRRGVEDDLAGTTESELLGVGRRREVDETTPCTSACASASDAKAT